jgi:hypothetical protein
MLCEERDLVRHQTLDHRRVIDLEVVGRIVLRDTAGASLATLTAMAGSMRSSWSLTQTRRGQRTRRAIDAAS